MALPANYRAVDTDTFTAGDGNWNVLAGTFVFALGSATLSLVANNIAVWRGIGVFPQNQWAQAKVTSLGNNSYCGAAVCAQAGPTWYDFALQVSTGIWFLRKTVAGASSNLATGTTAPVAGDTVTLAYYNGKLYAYHNGTLITSSTDSSISGGYPGLFGYVSTPSVVYSQATVGNMLPRGAGLLLGVG